VNEVYSKPVIFCTKSRRGDGQNTPIRTLTEIFDMDGKLIADSDPLPITIESALEFLKENDLLTGAVSQAFRAKFID